MDKIRIQEFIVVEGKDDTNAILRAVEADTIETGGSALNASTIETIRLAQQRRGVIIFTDPDHPGERIRSLIHEQVPGCKHAFIDIKRAKSKGKVGVEHADPEAIQDALQSVHTIAIAPVDEVWTIHHLMRAGLASGAGSAERRSRMGELLKLGSCNGKQFLKRCNQFGITVDEFEQALRTVHKEEEEQHG
ncbi:ribonuclease M5 [Marinicrinis sediminis]|uniref:Ribonuclease M5 n=1 Tax=Marinicrinis sediminis TaxID=1652465 RepID=A0ABW5R993_9BACL